MPYRHDRRNLFFRALVLAAFALAAVAGSETGLWLTRHAGEETAVALVRVIALTGDTLAVYRAP